MHVIDNLRHPLCPPRERFDDNDALVRVDAFNLIANERREPTLFTLDVQDVPNPVRGVNTRDAKLLHITRERRLCDIKARFPQSLAKLILTRDGLMRDDVFNGKVTILLVHSLSGVVQSSVHCINDESLILDTVE